MNLEFIKGWSDTEEVEINERQVHFASCEQWNSSTTAQVLQHTSKFIGFYIISQTILFFGETKGNEEILLTLRQGSWKFSHLGRNSAALSMWANLYLPTHACLRGNIYSIVYLLFGYRIRNRRERNFNVAAQSVAYLDMDLKCIEECWLKLTFFELREYPFLLMDILVHCQWTSEVMFLASGMKNSSNIRK